MCGFCPLELENLYRDNSCLAGLKVMNLKGQLYHYMGKMKGTNMFGEVKKSCHILCIVRRRGGEMAQL